MNLYEEYGKACVALEIAQNKVMELKRLIAEDIKKPKPAETNNGNVSEA